MTWRFSNREREREKSRLKSVNEKEIMRAIKMRCKLCSFYLLVSFQKFEEREEKRRWEWDMCYWGKTRKGGP